jgi:hypothetical protein
MNVGLVLQPGHSPYRDCSGLHQRPLVLLHCEMDFSSHAEMEMPQAQTVESGWGRIGLTADFRCVCTSEKLGRSPERPLFSSCPIQFAGAANVGSPPFVTARDFKLTRFRTCSESSLCPLIYKDG